MKKWMPYVATACIFGLMFWMFGCNPQPKEAVDAPVQETAQPLTEEPAEAEAEVKVVHDVVPEAIEPEPAPADEGTGDKVVPESE